ncbi:MAG TPA: hypothetical protein EYQ50_10200 [Verrucomicrobiales bacterium]|nr:hypothetical protein [Verrucomicrobiales bacterium]
MTSRVIINHLGPSVFRTSMACFTLSLCGLLNAEIFEIPQDAPAAKEGRVDADIYVQFHVIDVPGIGNIWTRAYGPSLYNPIIPGQTMRIKPGNLLHVDFFNRLEEKDSPHLKEFDRDIPLSDNDQIAQHVFHEINVPHNPNNTNLHVHGLHVDPSRDDVTIVVIPKGEDPSKYAFDVSDQSVKEGEWDYYYKIPDIHLPGTHWYHAHKHGSTALHVENGMAGAIIMEEADPLGGINGENDRVMLMQGLLNYAPQLGPGQGTGGGDQASGSNAVQGGNVAGGDPTVTVNGVVNPTLSIKGNQIERWRIINGTANHKSFGYFWLGEITETDENGRASAIRQEAMYVVAVDGITLPELIEVTAQAPLMLSPGNRADVLVQLPAGPNEYGLFKNLPALNPGRERGVDAILPKITPELQSPMSDTVLFGGPRLNPYLFVDPDKSGPAFSQHTTNWRNNSNETKPLPIVPLLRIEPSSVNGSILAEVKFTAGEPTVNSVGWQAAPHSGGGAITAEQILTVNVSGTGTTTGLVTDIDPSSQSPTGTMESVPDYTSPIADSDILQSRASVFDLSGINLDYQYINNNGEEKTQEIRQFTLNGRQFAIDDFIGNPEALTQVSGSVTEQLAEIISGVSPVLTIGYHDVTGH